MNNKKFIQKYEELLNSGYCDCNELNCLDNNPPKKILNIMKEQQQEIERLNKIIKKVSEILNNKRDKMIMQQFDCDFEELLYKIDEEIRNLLKENK